MRTQAITVTIVTRSQLLEEHPAYQDFADEVDLYQGDPVQSTRIAAVKLGRMLRTNKLTSVAATIPQVASQEDALTFVRAWTEGFVLGVYRIKSYKRTVEVLPQAVQLFLIIDDHRLHAAAKQVADYALIIASHTNYARDLTNLPSNLLTPDALAQEAIRLSEEWDMNCEILDEEEIRIRGMGGLTAVGGGSVHPPRMITLQYNGNPASAEVLGLVGKGVTFDTGGVSLKKAEGMEEMISDMGGAAVVLGIMGAIGQLKPKVNIVAVIAAAENMPSGSAYRPGDIITSLSGRTIEVLNTDAEGRIVLGDAMTYATQQGATKIIDVATLTGAVLVALGDIATGAVTNDDGFLRELQHAANTSGEKLWQLPAYPEYRKNLLSDVADLKNSGGKLAGTIMGALFIGEFAEGLPWIHLDTGGTAWLWEEKDIDPKGGTGAMVRTIIQYIMGIPA